MNSFNRRERISLAVLNVVLMLAFLGYHLFLDQYYCLSADDFSGIDYASHGIPGINYAWHYYWNWEGPFLTHFFIGLLMGAVSIGVTPAIGLLLLKLGMVASSATLLKAVSSRYVLSWDWTQVIFGALLYNMTLYIISTNQAEIWHWLIGSVYIIPLIFLQLGIAALLTNRFWWAIAALAFVMQSRATYAVIGFGFIALLTLFNWWKKTENRKQWLLLSAFLFLFLVLYLIAPGNYVRLKEHGNEFPFMITQFKIGVRNLFVSYNMAKMDRVLLGLLAVLPWVGFQDKTLRPKQLWQWCIPVVLYVGFAMAHEAFFVYITGWREWIRVFSIHSFLFLTTMFVYGFWLFSFVPTTWKRGLQLASFIGIGGLLFQLFNGFSHQLEMGDQLKTNYDARMMRIMEYDGIGDTLYVNPINYAGVLYFEDFSEDPDNWINLDFVKAYNLDFKVALEKQDEQ